MNPFSFMPEHAGTSQNPGMPLADKDWITVDEAVTYFRELGLPRSPEAIRGYCRDGKLEATTTQGLKGEQHVIQRRSAEIYIEDRKKVLASMSRDIPADASMSRKIPVHSVISRQMPEDAGTNRPEPDTAALAAKDAEISRLRDENMSLKIDKSARDQIVSMLRDERARLADQAMEKSRRVGELETRLELQLPPARPGGEGDSVPHADRFDAL